MWTIEPLQITFLRKLTATPAASGPLQVHPLPGRASSSSPPNPFPSSCTAFTSSMS